MGPRKFVWARCSKYSKPEIGSYVRVVDTGNLFQHIEFKEWVEAHKDQTFKVRAINETGVALYGVSFAVKFENLEQSLCLED